jgi:plastocyanin
MKSYFSKTRQLFLPLCVSTAFLSVVLLGNIAQGDDWGNLKGRFVYGGTPPTPVKLTADKDQEVCGKHDLFDEQLQVDPDTKGIENVIVYLFVSRGDKGAKIHPDMEKASGEPRIDNKDCRFEPHVLVVRTAQEFAIGNKDTVGHNTKIDSVQNPGINPIVAATSEMKHKFSKEERMPVRVSCSIHPWMKAWVVVKDSPYVAVSNKAGEFSISNLPVGKWTFQVWHEFKSGTNITNAELGGKKAEWKKGRAEFEIKAGDNDLGDITIPETVFKK